MAEEIELAIALDHETPGSLPAKLVRAVRQAIDEGVLRAGDQLPPTRVLAARLGVSRGTVVTAYEQLVAEGYFVAGQGQGTRVNPDLAKVHGWGGRDYSQPEQRALGPAQQRLQLQAPHRPQARPDPLSDLTGRPAWRAAWRRAAISHRLHRSFPVEGDPVLLAEIAEHLRTMRGTVRSPGDLLVTAGAREGLGLLLAALGTAHSRELVIGVEEQGPKSLHEVALRHGARVVSLPVDDSGLVTTDLPIGTLDAVLVTPSHQYPRGSVLPLPRRQALLEWAARTGAVVIEDDFDTELRYVHAPLPTLAALDDPVQGVVATLGSYSATLSPGLAAGFLVLPENLRRIVTPVRKDLGCPVSPILQLALTELLASGELRRHVARQRRQHRA